MMLPLKRYQVHCLSVLADYLESVQSTGNADTAFYAATKEFYGRGVPYRQVPQLPRLPYVCVRIPTGGGKTLMASHAVGSVTKSLLQSRRSVVLWLVPTKTILQQTLSSLKDRDHPYRQALEQSLSGGPVSVLGLSEALAITKETLDNETCIIVSTLAALRVEDTEGRKIYDSAGSLEQHFAGLGSEALAKLDRDENGVIACSLANALRLHRPLVIMDEAHNARTTLSFDSLARFDPSCIIEFTATPETTQDPPNGRFASNILCSVSAAELKAESMIKLPIYLQVRASWLEALKESINIRNALEQEAIDEEAGSGEYIRPIVLIQAQPSYQSRATITATIVREALQHDFRIPSEQIAVSTGTRRDLEHIVLASHTCPIRYIITVQQLREGWDCPFAYVLCTLAEQTSKTAIEQILGRILRQPKASRKKRDSLNHAYAVATSNRFAEAAGALTEALVEAGFERLEVTDMLAAMGEGSPNRMGGLDLVAEAHVYEAVDLSSLPETTIGKVDYRAEDHTLVWHGVMSEDERTQLRRLLQLEESRAAVEQMFRLASGQSTQTYTAESTSIDRIRVPILAVRDHDRLRMFESSCFLDQEWDLRGCNAEIEEAEYSIAKGNGSVGRIDISSLGRLEVSFTQELRRDLALIQVDNPWSRDEIVTWLDQSIPHRDLTSIQVRAYVSRAITHLESVRGLSVAALQSDRFRLRDAIERRIREHRVEVLARSFQRFLLGPDMEVDYSNAFEFPDDYPARWYYEGSYVFQKHYHRLVGELGDEGEEPQCAEFIDSIPEVVAWIRNLERQPRHSFWLQTSTDRFYPDFVASLRDGRILVVEYKGRHLWSTEDSIEKRLVGSIWESKSDGRCVFRMVTDNTVESLRGIANGSDL